MKTLINPSPVLSNNFTVKQRPGLFYHHKDSGIISAMASDLMYERIEYRILNTLTIINPKTNGSMEFILTEFKQHNDDFISFIFKPVDQTKAKNLNITELKIFND